MQRVYLPNPFFFQLIIDCPPPQHTHVAHYLRMSLTDSFKNDSTRRHVKWLVDIWDGACEQTLQNYSCRP